MQPEATTNTSTEPAPSSGGQPAPQGPAAWGQPVLMMLVMFGVFYFFLFRPQQKRQRETDDLLKSLRKGDKVRTSGGIRGEIVDLSDSEVTLLIADKVKINVLRSHISSRAGTGTEAKEKA